MLKQPLLDDGVPSPDRFMWVRLIATVASVSLGSSFQFGFATGSLNNLSTIIPQALAEAGNPINIGLWAFINSCFSIGGLLGSYGVVVPLALLGRKKTLLLANVFVFLSSACMFFGTTWYVLVLGRISIGVVAGVAQMVAGSYMTEISPIGIRGSVGVCSQVGIVCGIAFANFLTAPSFQMLGSIDRWRFVFLVPSCFSLLQMLVLPWCPESPAFLIKKGGSQLALKTLLQLHRAESAAAHINNLRSEVAEGGKGEGDMDMCELLTSRTLRKQVLVGVVIKIGVQFSGIDAIFYYSSLMFTAAGVADPQLATTLLSLVNLMMTFIAMGIMERAGRRPLIMVTWVGMCFGFLTIFIAGSIGGSLAADSIYAALTSNVQVAAMVLIIVSFAVGVGNVEGFIISEIMPVYAKDTMMSIGQPLNWVANLVVSTLFPIVFVDMGRYAYLIFVGLTFSFGWFTFTRLPETKGRTIAQVTEEFTKY